MSFVSSELGIDSSNIGYRKGWSGANGKFAYMGQYIVRCSLVAHRCAAELGPSGWHPRCQCRCECGV